MPHLAPALTQWQHALALKPALAAQDDAVRAALARATPHGHFADWLGIVAARTQTPGHVDGANASEGNRQDPVTYVHAPTVPRARARCQT